MPDRYSERIEKIAAYLANWLADNSTHSWFIPQYPKLTMAKPKGTRFALLIQRGPIENKIEFSDTAMFGDEQVYDIFLMVNDAGLGDKDMALYYNIGVDEVFTALRDRAEVGDPAFGIENSEMGRIIGSEPGEYDGSYCERIQYTIVVHEDYS